VESFESVTDSDSGPNLKVGFVSVNNRVQTKIEDTACKIGNDYV